MRQNKNISPTLKTSALAAVALVSVLLAGCQAENFAPELTLPAEGISFGATVMETDAIRTRALDSAYVTADPYDLDFYIELSGNMPDDETGAMKYVSRIGTYIVPTGYEGRLNSKDAAKALQWQDLYSDHTFHAWTLPWEVEDSENPEEPDAGGKEEDPLAPMKVEFHNSAENDGFAEHNNGSVYERFIGAKSGPYNYRTHGKYVDLTFRHLVSKIYIGKLSLVKSDGSIQDHLRADITFIGMPNYGTFYPHPDDGRAPYVEPGPMNMDSGVTFFIDNNASTPDVFYVCPELDFSQLGFRVHVNSVEDYGSMGDYFGSFADVQFVRTGKGHEWDDENDETVLHAGEMMTLNIVLFQGKGPGMSVIITDWSTAQPQETVHHVHPGFYTDGEVKDMLGVFVSKYDPKDAERMFELYGDEESGKFFLYDNVTVDGVSFLVGKDYILDGTGHVVTMKANRLWNVHGGHPYVNLGPIRNVYIVAEDYKMWIDEDGNIFLYNPETDDYDIRGGQLAPFDENNPNHSYDVDLTTGAVIESTYPFQ